MWFKIQAPVISTIIGSGKMTNYFGEPCLAFENFNGELLILQTKLHLIMLEQVPFNSYRMNSQDDGTNGSSNQNLGITWSVMIFPYCSDLAVINVLI